MVLIKVGLFITNNKIIINPTPIPIGGNSNPIPTNIPALTKTPMDTLPCIANNPTIINATITIPIESLALIFTI